MTTFCSRGTRNPGNVAGIARNCANPSAWAGGGAVTGTSIKEDAGMEDATGSDPRDNFCVAS